MQQSKLPRLMGRMLALAALLATFQTAAAQDLNYLFPIREIESRLTDQPFRIIDWRGSRAPGDRTSRAAHEYADGSTLVVKWALAPSAGATFNNEPRYEVAAYELQKLFLEEDEYAVPPTVMRAFPLDFVRQHVPDATATFREAPASVLVCLQYWLLAVTPDKFWDSQRARNDSVYARYVANFNILTHIIRHNDANVGNFLISQSDEKPRVFSVDNGVAFSSPESNRGHEWRDMQVRRLPHATIERLRGITREQLTQKLGVLIEFEVRDGELVQVPPGQNMSPGRGVRRSSQRIQLGLTETEIRAVERRIQNLVRQADGRRFEIF
jgi:hypothetical protein